MKLALLSLLIEALLLAGSLGLVRLFFVNLNLGTLILKIFALAMMIIPYSLIFIAIFLLRRPKKLPHENQPAGVPRNAVPVTVAVRSHDTSLGRSAGWMWIDRSWLCFRGKQFGFRLQASDFKSKVTPQSMTGALFFALPNPFPRTGLWIMPRLLRGDRFEKWSVKEQLGDELSVWREAAQTSEPRLYPPVRPQSQTVRILPGILSWTAMGIAVGSLFAVFFLLLPADVLPKGNPLAAGLGFALLLPMIFAMSSFSNAMTRKSREHELRKAAEAG